ncbi:non-specific serine/threonine protein kinase [Salvia divinorum]|uniref:Non-specific serine/threonine protein kinase n=1 Tax=Salvia divinorum TaxID=28513 RepID=A0ABD1FVL3_SALDI
MSTSIASQFVVAAVTGYFHSIARAAYAKGVNDSLQLCLEKTSLSSFLLSVNFWSSIECSMRILKKLKGTIDSWQHCFSETKSSVPAEVMSDPLSDMEREYRTDPQKPHQYKRHFNIELLKKSPSPALRTCAKLAQLQPFVERELFPAERGLRRQYKYKINGKLKFLSETSDYINN